MSSKKFLSTPSARRATKVLLTMCQLFEISIHALREEGDALSSRSYRSATKFLSTPSARRATSDGIAKNSSLLISIHALREEGDFQLLPVLDPGGRFLSTPSARRATNSLNGWATDIKFLSTPSARRATGKPRPWRRHKKISIHALREEGDAINLDLAKFVLHFYPRPPRGGRLVAASAFTPLSNFYPRPPRGGRPKRTNC